MSDRLIRLFIALVGTGMAYQLKDMALSNIEVDNVKPMWIDLYVAGNWRIQQSKKSGLYRVLDPQNMRHGLGKHEEMIEYFDSIYNY